MSVAFADCYDPSGERFGIPTFPWELAPEGYATRRQLRARGLRPGGQDIAAQLMRPRKKRGPLVAYLYRWELAKPVRPMTPASGPRSPWRCAPAAPARPAAGTPAYCIPPSACA